MEKMKSLVALTILAYMGIECCYAQKKIDEAYTTMVTTVFWSAPSPVVV